MLLALICVAFVTLLLLLPQPPDIETGGKTTVIRRIPDLRDTVDPIARAKAPDEIIPVPSPAPAPAPQLPKKQQGLKIVLPPAEPAPPGPVKKPQLTTPPAPKPAALPEIDIARLPPEPAPGGRVDLPSRSDIRDWVKSQAWEFLGGVDEAGNILYRFEVWLEAPANMLKAIKSVSYVYDAPSATPPSRDTDLSNGGFRVRFGGKSCAQKITVTLTMSDGRSRRAVVDGCRALN
ncbi:MAG: hypothetical protein ACTSP0_04930 [Alphaproteobacteria bacterium]